MSPNSSLTYCPFLATFLCPLSPKHAKFSSWKNFGSSSDWQQDLGNFKRLDFSDSQFPHESFHCRTAVNTECTILCLDCGGSLITWLDVSVQFIEPVSLEGVDVSGHKLYCHKLEINCITHVVTVLGQDSLSPNVTSCPQPAFCHYPWRPLAIADIPQPEAPCTFLRF